MRRLWHCSTVLPGRSSPRPSYFVRPGRRKEQTGTRSLWFIQSLIVFAALLVCMSHMAGAAAAPSGFSRGDSIYDGRLEATPSRAHLLITRSSPKERVTAASATAWIPPIHSLGRSGVIVDLCICVASVLGSLSIILPYFIHKHNRKLRHALILGLATSDLVAALITVSTTAFLLNGGSLSDSWRYCDFSGFALATAIFTQHLWNLAIGVITYMILTHPLSRATLTVERYIVWLWPAFWALGMIVNAFPWIFLGWTDNGGYCGMVSKPSSLLSPLIQFIPRGFVFIVLLVLYTHLFFFLRRTSFFSKASSRSGGCARRNEQNVSFLHGRAPAPRGRTLASLCGDAESRATHADTAAGATHSTATNSDQTQVPSNNADLAGKGIIAAIPSATAGAGAHAARATLPKAPGSLKSTLSLKGTSLSNDKNSDPTRLTSTHGTLPRGHAAGEGGGKRGGTRRLAGLCRCFGLQPLSQNRAHDMCSSGSASCNGSGSKSGSIVNVQLRQLPVSIADAPAAGAGVEGANASASGQIAARKVCESAGAPFPLRQQVPAGDASGRNDDSTGISSTAWPALEGGTSQQETLPNAPPSHRSISRCTNPSPTILPVVALNGGSHMDDFTRRADESNANFGDDEEGNNDDDDEGIAPTRWALSPRKDAVDFQMTSPPQEHLNHFSNVDFAPLDAVTSIEGALTSRVAGAMSLGANASRPNSAKSDNFFKTHPSARPWTPMSLVAPTLVGSPTTPSGAAAGPHNFKLEPGEELHWGQNVGGPSRRNSRAISAAAPAHASVGGDSGADCSGTGEGEHSASSSAGAEGVESIGSTLNRQASVLMLLYPTAYCILFSVSIIRLISDLATDNKLTSPGKTTALYSVSRWFVFAQGAFDAVIFQIVEKHFRKRMKRRRKRALGEQVDEEFLCKVTRRVVGAYRRLFGRGISS
ncbi:hypothetical protein K437DRAFT_261712 [Tilletiaria anomala UBC 951]|uniref:G-protein coupled receptors family 1 profile domain-containing protein n=1 Tax=Tilletiaria anomala (strain ATCC 24038 / CBS 436.72 / UBC 951) TaxID=1037660 RepID=A0A066WN14_TILAU|nr:uncharacterized protein K437DRAFT_261712 [Tilletiaria anomala UBC 951]KDN52025.1 hypothetical protein K437DRAFT_261712 [Tilletiaria anomala UBC 951]